MSNFVQKPLHHYKHFDQHKYMAVTENFTAPVIYHTVQHEKKVMTEGTTKERYQFAVWPSGYFHNFPICSQKTP